MTPTYLFDILAALFVVSFISWVATQSGQVILKFFVKEKLFSRLEEVALGSALGFGFLSYLTFALGSLALWYKSLFWFVLVLLSVFFVVRKRRRKAAGKPASLIGSAPGSRLWTTLLVIFLLCYAFGDLTPEVFYDALYYHLAVPDLYRLAHRIYNLPDYLYANFILMMQMLYGLATTLGPAISAKLLHGVMAILLAVGMITFGQRFLSPGAGALSALLFLSVPAFAANVMTGGVDAGSCYFQFMAVFAVALALTQPQAAFWRLAGTLTGLSAACKYTAFPFIPFSALVILWLRRRERLPWKLILSELLNFLIPAVLVLAPFLVRNWFFHSNPIYPFGGTWWGDPRISPERWKVLLDSNLPPAVQGSMSWLSWLIQPWLSTQPTSPYALQTGPVFLLLAPLVIFVKARNDAQRFLKCYAALLWILWITTTGSIRQGLPTLVLFAPLMAEAVLRAARRVPARRLLQAGVLAGSLCNFYFIARLMGVIEGWEVVLGSKTKENYLKEMHPSYPFPPYEGIQWMNKNLPVGSKILFIGEARSFYTQVPAVVSAFADKQPMVEWSRDSQNGDEMAQKVKDAGITHLFFNDVEAIRLKGYNLFHWEASSWKVLEDFWGHYTRLVWKKEDNDPDNPKALYVYEVTPGRLLQPVAPNPFQRWARSDISTTSKGR